MKYLTVVCHRFLVYRNLTVSLTGCQPGYSLRYHLLTHKRKSPSGGRNGKKLNEGGVEHRGGECLSVCAFLHPWVSAYLCVQLWLERGERGLFVPVDGLGSAPQLFSQRTYSYYACWWYLWEGKVWYWRIRSGPVNERHAQCLHSSLSSQLLPFLFWSISFTPWYDFIINTLYCHRV